ncbi:MAG: TetR/AcrR family transcriptional regulator [Calditrichaeota bacterium]|nr:MAG: TetR/AcrR family transcriptional regulator [Calditrichota bacterium]
MKTKEKIILKSIEMFNSKGISKVTIRHIANELGISHGNLGYHFKSKGLIVSEIYNRMVEEINNLVLPPNSESLTLNHYNILLLQVLNFQKKYIFFYLDLIEIFRLFPEIAKKHEKTYTLRIAQNQKLFQNFIEQNLIKPESQTGTYNRVIHTTWMLINFWISQQWVFQTESPVLQTHFTLRQLWDLLIPHLTEKGKIEYQNLNL